MYNEDCLNTSPSERFKTSISNCAAWLQSTSNDTSLEEADADANEKKSPRGKKQKKINLPDMSQPPPPIFSTYVNNNNNNMSAQKHPPLPPLPPLPPMPPPLPPNQPSTPPLPPPPLPPTSSFRGPSTPPHEPTRPTSKLRDKEKDRTRRGLPNIRDNHLCSKYSS